MVGQAQFRPRPSLSRTILNPSTKHDSRTGVCALHVGGLNCSAVPNGLEPLALKRLEACRDRRSGESAFSGHLAMTPARSHLDMEMHCTAQPPPLKRWLVERGGRDSPLGVRSTRARSKELHIKPAPNRCKTETFETNCAIRELVTANIAAHAMW